MNHSIAQMLSLVVTERRDNWDQYPPHVESGYDCPASSSTVLAPNEIHLGRFPHLSVTITKRRLACEHQSLDRNHIEYCCLTSERKRLANELVQAHHDFASSCITRADQGLNDVFHKRPICAVGNRVWVYNILTAVQQSRDMNDEHVVNSKVSLR